MAGGRRGSFSDSVSDPDLETNIKGLDDLEDELFGDSLHKRQPSAQRQKTKENSLPKSQSKAKTFKDFDDDDPLAGLLSDEDEPSEKKFGTKKSEERKQDYEEITRAEKVSTSPAKKQNKEPVESSDAVALDQARAQQNFNILSSPVKSKPPVASERKKAKDVDFDDSFDLLDGLGLDDKRSDKKEVITSSPVKGRSFMDDLLGKENEEKKKTEFVLGAKYKKSATKVIADKDSDDVQFGSYVPSSVIDNKPSGRRTVRFGDESEIGHAGGQGLLGRTHLDSRDDDKFGGILSSKRRKDEGIGSRVKELAKGDDKTELSIGSRNEKKDIGIGSKQKSHGSDWLGLGETSSTVDRPLSSGKDSSLDWLDSNDKNGKYTTHYNDVKNVEESSRTVGTSLPPPTEKKIGAIDSAKDTDSDWLALKEKFASRAKQSTDKDVTDASTLRPLKQQKETKLEVSSAPNLPAMSLSEPQIQSNAVTGQMMALQGVLSGLQAERAQLLQSVETLQNRHQEELKSVENFHQLQMKSLQESCYQREERLIKDNELKMKELESKIHNMGTEKMDLITNYQQKLEKQELEKRQEVQRLKEIHNQAIAALKQDHEDALGRLRHLKDQEVEAISSTQVYTRSLQSLTDQLEARAAELSILQQKVDEKHQKALQDRQALLEAKDKQLKALETRLQKQLGDAEEERSHLQQLILRLENRLQQQTKDLEEERWQLQQRSARLEVQQKALVEEKKQTEDQMKREREKLQLMKESVMQEQKSVLLQLAQDRQKLEAERADMEHVLRKRLEEESRINSKRFQEEANHESQRRTLHQERDKIQTDWERLRQEQSWIQQERESLVQELRKIQEEKEKLHDLGLQLKRRSEEVEDMCLSATQAREEGKLALQAARQIEMDQKKQSSQMVNQLQAALEKERQILQEREALAAERRKLEMKKDSLLCANCHLSLNHPLPVRPPPVIVPLKSTNAADDQLQLLSLAKDPALLVWQITAKKDKEFLEEEGSFLDSLKNNSPRVQEVKEVG